MTEEYHWDDCNVTTVGQYLDSQEKMIVNEFLNTCAPGSCLDIACGSGRFSLSLIDWGMEVVATDINRIGLKKLNHKASGTRNTKKPIHAMQVDAHSLPFREETFDYVFAFQGVGYLEKQQFFSGCNRVLKEGGWLLFNEANRHSYKAPFHRRLSSSTQFYRHSHLEICSMLAENGFQIVKATGMNWLPTKRSSDYQWVPFASKIENKLRLSAFPSISPWVLYVTQKNGHTLDDPRSDTTGGDQW